MILFNKDSRWSLPPHDNLDSRFRGNDKSGGGNDKNRGGNDKNGGENNTYFLLLISYSVTSPVFADDIHDIKGPVDFPPHFTYLFLLSVLAIVMIGYFLARYFLNRFGNKKKSFEIPKPPHVIAYERLRALERQNLPGQGKSKGYYFELSDIIRRYIEGRFQINAPEMTTEEFLGNLKDSVPHKSLLKDFMTSCDMVKFAKYTPGPNEAQESFKLAWKFVDETKQDVEPQVIETKK